MKQPCVISRELSLIVIVDFLLIKVELALAGDLRLQLKEKHSLIVKILCL